jgi:hypothetical protein
MEMIGVAQNSGLLSTYLAVMDRDTVLLRTILLPVYNTMLVPMFVNCLSFMQFSLLLLVDDHLV